MPLVLTSGPSTEPVTVAEAKAHARIDSSAEDALIASLILAARLHLETALGLALITQSWRLELDAWPTMPSLTLPIRPLQAVTAVRVRDSSGASIIVPNTDYLVDTASMPPRLVAVNAGWPAPGRKAAGIEIDLTAGYGTAASSVPAPLRQALLMLVTHWFEHRLPVEVGVATTRMPASVSELVTPFRIARL